MCCYLSQAQSIVRVGRRSFLFAATAQIIGTFLFPVPAKSQGWMRVFPGDAPDDGEKYPEFLIAGLRVKFGVIALATVYQGKLVIFYDWQIADRLGGFKSAAMRFIRAHEYGHHRQDHTSKMLQGQMANPFSYKWLYHQGELEADCWATQTLRDNDDQEAINAGISLYMQATFPHSFPGMPGSIERRKNIEKCKED